MKVLFLLPSFSAGGAERVALQLARVLSANAHENKACGPTADRNAFCPVVLALDSAGPLIDRIPPGVRLVTLGHRRLRSAIVPLLRALRNERPDVIVSTFSYLTAVLVTMRMRLDWSPMIVAREANLPSMRLRRGVIERLIRVSARWAYPRCDLLLASSRRMAEELIVHLSVSPDRIEQLPNPVDEQEIRKQALSSTPARSSCRLFVASGRLVPQKGFDRLLELWPTLPNDCTLAVLGTGPQWDKLNQLAASLDIADRIRFLGYKDNPWSWYRASEALLVPSRFEGMPNAALEALACGTPVIATPESGGLPELAADIQNPRHLTIAAFGAPFRDAIAASSKRDPAGIADSMLPRPYRLEEVAKRFRGLLASVHARRLESESRR